MDKIDLTKKSLEIERKWILSSDIDALHRSSDIDLEIKSERFYLEYNHPQIEIRVRHDMYTYLNLEDYLYDIKFGNGLVREEYSMRISKNVWDALKARALLIYKSRRFHVITKSGKDLVCYTTDLEPGIWYAEIEFKDLSSAKDYKPEFYYQLEVTDDLRYSQKSIYKRNLSSIKIVNTSLGCDPTCNRHKCTVCYNRHV